MLVEATRPQGWLWVDWWLLNHCAWRCSYCPDLLRSGSIPKPSLRDCQHFVSELTRYASQQGLKPRIKFTGGEPTEWSSLDDLLALCQQLGMTTSLRTNANVEHSRWQTLIEGLTDLEMNFHPEHTQTSVYMLNLDRAVAQGINVRAVFNMLPQRFDELELVREKIQSKYPSVGIDRRMLFEDPAVNHRPMQYTETQQVKLIRQSGDIRITDDAEISYTDYPTMVSEGSNRFQDWNCRIGLEQLIVDAWGRVRKGHCGQGGSMGTVGGAILWPDQPLLCRRPSCDNAFDILATKTRV
jgi:organic radical activating enzyme